MARQDTSSSQLGILLLRGFTMLAEACPECHIPLMRDPSTMQSQCVGCHHSFSPAAVQALSDPQHSQPPMESAPPSGPQHTAAAGAAGPTNTGHQPRPMNGPLTSALARHRRATSTSGSSDGAGSPGLMPAQGPVTPAAAPAAAALVSPPLSAVPSSNGGIGLELEGRGPLQQQQQQAAEDDEVLQAYQQIRAERQLQERQQLLNAGRQQHLQQPNGVEASPGAAAGAAAGLPRQRTRDVSQLMADKMLAGWALLGDHCPMCSTPLMRERGTRQVYCVACDLPVRVEQQQQQQQQQQAATVPGSTPTADAAAVSQVSPQQRTQQEAAAGLDMDTQARAGTEARRAAVGAAAGHALLGAQQEQREAAAPAAVSAGIQQGVSAAAGEQSDKLTGSRQQVLEGLHQALLVKLSEAQQHLLATPVSQHEQLGQQLQLVQQLLHTLAAVQQ